MSGEHYRQSSRAPARTYTPPLIATERDFHQKLIDEVRETRRFVDNALDRLSYLERLVKNYVAPASAYALPLERRLSYDQRDDVATGYVPPTYAPHSPKRRDPLPGRSRYFTDVLPENRTGYSVHAHRREPMGPEDYRQSWHHLPHMESHHHTRSPPADPPRRTSGAVYENSPQLWEGAWKPERSPYEERTHRRNRDGGEGPVDPLDVTWTPSREQEHLHSRNDPRPGEGSWIPRNGPTFVPALMPAPRKRRRSINEEDRDPGNVGSWKRPRGEPRHADVHDWLRVVDANTLSPTYRPDSPPPPPPASPPRMGEARIEEAPEWTRTNEDGPSALPPSRQTSPVHDTILYTPVSKSVVLPPSLAYKEELRRSRSFPDERPSSSGRTVRDSPGDLQWVGSEEQ
ncbi:hypothetical protein DFS33DRAFT_1385399 [Desarmillaria ectypa]|nr:hypothetical protein DFS33DRAFT_1385399 [Desarmillaria ectypa]